MKKLLLMLVLVMLLPLVSSGQYYWGLYAQNNNGDLKDLNKDQLDLALNKANNTINTGKYLTYIGLAVGVGGTIVYFSGLNSIETSTDIDGIYSGYNKGMAGIYIGAAGYTLAAVGIPLWIYGGNRKDNIEIALKRFPSPSGNANGIGIKIRF